MLNRAYAVASIAFALSILTCTDATATAQRTFVASFGNDSNPCSLLGLRKIERCKRKANAQADN